MDAEKILALLRQHHLSPKRSLGQNFLSDSTILERTADACGADRSCGVVEVGPGLGSLTCLLAERAAKVVALERDPDLLPVLHQVTAGYDEVSFILADASRTDYAELVRSEISPLRPMFCANLPYNISNALVLKVLSLRLFETVCVMVQREAAHRFAAGPDSQLYTETSVLCRYYAEPEVLFDVPARCFFPAPHVSSAVIRFTPKPLPNGFDEAADRLFHRIVHSAFSSRRKQFINNLTRDFSIPEERWESWLALCGYPRTVRGEKLSCDDFIRLTEYALSAESEPV